MSTNRYDFNFPEAARRRRAARLLYVSSAKYGGDWHSTPHTHGCSELFYVTGGTGQFLIEDQIFPVAPDDLIIVNPGVEHTEQGLNASPLEYIVLGIEGLELSAIGGEENAPYCIVNFRGMKDSILFYLKSMLSEIETKAPGYEIICSSLMDILSVHLTRQTGFSAALTPVRRKSSHLCAAVRRYIDSHYKENISLDLLASMNHVSKYYMVHAFTEEYGVSPMNYMIRIRIDEACLLLKNDDYSLALISRMLGFSSPSYFSQSFKKLEHISPTEYRSRCKQEADRRADGD